MAKKLTKKAADLKQALPSPQQLVEQLQHHTDR